jgi:hypothetical protein
MEGREMHTEFRQKAFRNKGFVGDPGVDVSTVLKQILETWGAGMCIVFIWARIGSNV